MPVVQASPRQPGLVVGGAQVLAEVVHVAAAALGAGEVPVAERRPGLAAAMQIEDGNAGL